MPIRINLLAEAQAAEELRRKDPVKRAILAGSVIVVLVLSWGSKLQFQIISSKGELKGLEGKWTSIEQNYQDAVESKRKSIEVESKLSALQQLRTNRFLWGNALDAFQQTLSGVDDIQVVRLKTEQSYYQSEDLKVKTADGKQTGGKSTLATEKIGMVIDAVDSGAQPGNQVSRFKEAIANVPYFQSSLAKTNGVRLTSLSAPMAGPLGRNPYVMFTLQCYFPEKVR
jgi:hypothetical protein